MKGEPCVLKVGFHIRVLQLNYRSCHLAMNGGLESSDLGVHGGLSNSSELNFFLFVCFYQVARSQDLRTSGASMETFVNDLLLRMSYLV